MALSCTVYEIYELKKFCDLEILGPDLQRILCQTYASAGHMPDLRQPCELQAINKQEAKLSLG